MYIIVHYNVLHEDTFYLYLGFLVLLNSNIENGAFFGRIVFQKFNKLTKANMHTYIASIGAKCLPRLSQFIPAKSICELCILAHSVWRCRDVNAKWLALQTADACFPPFKSSTSHRENERRRGSLLWNWTYLL